MEPINLAATLAQLSEPWSPRTVAMVNDYDVRLVRVLGEFARHRHPDTDELFLVLDGLLEIWMDTGCVRLGPGELYVVPTGAYHQPVAERETKVLMFEPSPMIGTGTPGGAFTAARVEL